MEIFTGKEQLNYAFIADGAILEQIQAKSYLEANAYLKHKQGYLSWWKDARIYLEVPTDKNTTV